MRSTKSPYRLDHQYMIQTGMKITEARSHLADIVRDANMHDEPTVITQNGKPAAVVIGFEEWKELTAERDARITARVRSRMAEYVSHEDVLREAGLA
jgi:prevent-host-death family protein